jgi:hypothetical protein
VTSWKETVGSQTTKVAADDQPMAVTGAESCAAVVILKSASMIEQTASLAAMVIFQGAYG